MLELLKDELILREFTQFSMIFSMIANLSISIVFLYFYIIERKKVFLFFSLSWLIFGVSHIFKFFRVEQHNIYLDILSGLSTSLSIILLIAGIFACVNLKNKYLKIFIYFFYAFLIAISIISPLFSLPIIQSRISIYFAYGFAEIALGFILLKKENYSFLPAIGLILWGIHKFNYPFLVDTSFGPFGYMIGFILGLFIAIGLMIMLSLKERKEIIKSSNALNSAYEKLKIQRKDMSKILSAISHNLRTPLTSLNEACKILEINLDTSNPDNNYMVAKNLINTIDSNIQRIYNELKKIEQLFDFLNISSKFNFEPVRVEDILADLSYKFKNEPLTPKIPIHNHLSSDRLIYADKEKLNFTLFALFTLLKSKNIAKEVKFAVNENENSIFFCYKNLSDNKLSFINPENKDKFPDRETTEKMLDDEIVGFITESIAKHRGKISVNQADSEGEIKLCIELPKYFSE